MSLIVPPPPAAHSTTTITTITTSTTTTTTVVYYYCHYYFYYLYKQMLPSPSHTSTPVFVIIATLSKQITITTSNIINNAISDMHIIYEHLIGTEDSTMKLQATLKITMVMASFNTLSPNTM
jgi:hypothetical protein